MSSLFFWLFSLSVFSSSSEAQTLIEENQSRFFSGSQYVLLVHPDDLSDPFRVASEGVLRLVEEARSRNIPLIELVPPESKDFAFKNLTPADFLVISSAGQHALRFAPGAVVFIGGGNLSLCLCETLRDLIAAADGELNLILAADAIYDLEAYWLGVGLGLSKTTLERLLNRQELSKQRFLSGFFVNVLGFGDFKRRELCPYQNIYSAPGLRIEDYSLELIVDGEVFSFEARNKASAPRIRLLFYSQTP